MFCPHHESMSKSLPALKISLGGWGNHALIFFAHMPEVYEYYFIPVLGNMSFFLQVTCTCISDNIFQQEEEEKKMVLHEFRRILPNFCSKLVTLTKFGLGGGGGAQCSLPLPCLIHLCSCYHPIPMIAQTSFLCLHDRT